MIKTAGNIIFQFDLGDLRQFKGDKIAQGIFIKYLKIINRKVNYDKEKISIEYLSSLCAISTVHFRNTFIKLFARSPVKYINDLKMTRAKELLDSQFYTVSEVCFLSGYNNESYFSREFKKHLGISPSEYAKASRK